MSVILSRNCPFAPGADERCTLCSERLSPPDVHWRGHTDLNLCHRCCADLKRGLVPDLIQVGAIEELWAAGCYGATLVRTSTRAVADADAKEGARICGRS